MLDTRATALTHLVEALDASMSGTQAGSWLLRLAESSGGDPSLGLLPLDDADHPVDALLGFVADASWTAVGVIVHGQAHDLGQDDPCAPATPVRLVHIVDRDGVEVSALRRFDGSDLVTLAGPGEGRLADCCRRVLRLPTAPAPSPPLHWFATIWLEAVLRDAIADPSRVVAWADVARLHPLVTRPVPADPVLLASIVARAAAAVDWEGLRLEAAAASEGPLSGANAAWMDAGMFARWRLARLPEPVDLLIDLAGLLPASVVEPLVTVMEAWDLW